MPKGRVIFTIVAALAAVLGRPAGAEEIAVGNFGVAANGMPFGVARAKGFFKQEGIDVTGIITSAGGGTSLRNMLAGGVPYGEVNPAVVVWCRRKLLPELGPHRADHHYRLVPRE